MISKTVCLAVIGLCAGFSFAQTNINADAYQRCRHEVTFKYQSCGTECSKQRWDEYEQCKSRYPVMYRVDANNEQRLRCLNAIPTNQIRQRSQACYDKFPIKMINVPGVSVEDTDSELEDFVKVQGMSWNVAGTLRLVKEFEGLRLTAYQDSVGVWTIGYGHTGSDVKPGMTITQAKADSLLQNDLARFNSCVTSSINKPLNPNQVGALMSFSFNVGCGALQGSTLRRRINAGENPNLVASEELPKWNKAGGRALPGLTRRRAAEVAFFKS